MPDYETITVTGNETYDLFDDFDGHCENVLFDMTASGARARLNAMGDGDWVIRNVAFKGTVDENVSYHDSAQIKPAVYGDGDGLIENVWLGDGAVSGTETNGVLVEDEHSGTLTFRNVYISGFTDNGLYCSDAGYTGHDVLEPGHGAVIIENCFGYNNNITQFRIGSAGSVVRDSVAYVDDLDNVPVHSNGGLNARGVRMHHTDDNRVENCDITTDGSDAIQAKDGGGGTVVDTRVDGPISDHEGPIYIEGDTSGEPSTEPPDGVPTSADAAASGSTDDGTDEDYNTDDMHVLEVLTPADGDLLEYGFNVVGTVVGVDQNDDVSEHYAENNDDIERGDNTDSVTGVTSNGFGDAFYIDGYVDEFTTNGAEYSLRWDGEPITVEELTSMNDDTDDGTEDGSNDEPDDYEDHPERELAVRGGGDIEGTVQATFIVDGQMVSADTTETTGAASMERVDSSTIKLIAEDIGASETVRWGYRGTVVGVQLASNDAVQFTTDADASPLSPDDGDSEPAAALSDGQQTEVEQLIADALDAYDPDVDAPDAVDDEVVRETVRAELQKAVDQLLGYGN